MHGGTQLQAGITEIVGDAIVAMEAGLVDELDKVKVRLERAYLV